MTRADSESPSPQDDGGADSQGQGPVLIASLISVPAQPQAVDQPEVRIETEPRVIGDEAGLDANPQHLVTSHESGDSFSIHPEANGGRYPMSSVGPPSDFSITRQVHPEEPQADDAGVRVPAAEQESAKVVKDSGRITADLGGPTPVPKDVIPAEPLLSQNTDIHQVVQSALQKTALEGMVAKVDTVKQDGEPVDYSVPNQTAGAVRSLSEHGALGASTEQSSSHGRQSDDAPEQFSELWSHRNGRQMETAEAKIPQAFVVDHQAAHGSGVEPAALALSRQAVVSAPGTPAPTSVAAQVQPGLSLEEMSRPTGIPGMRSVVVNVAQPDLGHVNIRVALTHDVVHTYFSSDRLEVGQFFINGQDRLQAALQASGLDLGQFRVDIDRQSGGRSFQQGSSQEQGQSWSQDSHGMGQELHSEQQGQSRGTRHGLLNVIA
jgi:hypothetical protein